MNPLPRRTVLRACLAAIVAIPLAAHAADTQAVIAPINALDEALIATMKAASAGAPFVQRYRALAPVIQRVFDLPEILQVSVGPAWSTIPTQLQGQLLDEFERYTVASYVANFNSYSGQRFEVSPTVRAVGANQVVQTKLIGSDGTSTRIDYVMRNKGGEWKIVDVLLDGTISRVAVQRSDFRSEISSGGGQGLLTSLKRKVAQLSGGAMQ
jgi:phospholipid transport system substrate-binding protein